MALHVFFFVTMGLEFNRWISSKYGRGCQSYAGCLRAVGAACSICVWRRMRLHWVSSRCVASTVFCHRLWSIVSFQNTKASYWLRFRRCVLIVHISSPDLRLPANCGTLMGPTSLGNASTHTIANDLAVIDLAFETTFVLRSTNLFGTIGHDGRLDQ